MTARELRSLMATEHLSTRLLASVLGVSAMWVSRRARGVVEITTDEAEQIREAVRVLAHS